MTITPRSAIMVCLGLVVAAGCRQADRAISAAPSHAELPTFEEEFEPTLAIRVGVEGAGDDRGIVIVPTYEKIEPTPEERKILGEKEELEIDALVFYRPPRGLQQGVSPEPFRRRTDVSGIGGAGVALDFAYPRYGTSGFAGRTFGADLFQRWVAGAGRARDSGADAGQAWAPRVGEDRAREPAQRERRRYH
ncbi:MAG: hypothetical protein KKI02_10925 [Planctomycetes bacterium]|nr:hypothetical protein [Planctomycetota bacterium]